jgi:hypothetical protein
MNVDAMSRPAAVAKEKAEWRFKKEIIFTVVLAGVALFAFISALSFPLGSGLFPMVIAAVLFVMTACQLIVELRQKVLIKEALDVRVEESQRGGEAMRRGARFLAWFAVLYAGIYLVGFEIVVVPWAAALMFVEGRIRWWRILIIMAVVAVLVLFVMPDFLEMSAPSGLLQDWLHMH